MPAPTSPRWLAAYGAALTALALTAGALHNDVLPLLGSRVVDRYEYVQAEHARLHFDEPPAGAPAVAFDNALGRLSFTCYLSDGCCRRVRTWPGRGTAASFVLDVEAQPAPSLAFGSGPLPPAATLLVDAAYASSGQECRSCPRHGRPATERRERVSECWERVTWGWAEGCSAVAHYNSCGRYWDAEASGDIKLCWLACAH